VHNAPQPQVAGYPEFFGTQPPLFNKMEEPLDANAWIRTIESKFALSTLPCPEANKANKARFATLPYCTYMVGQLFCNASG
jgi:hypothetical protein